MGEIEKYGTGFIRIRQWMMDYPEAGYEISEMGDFFRVQIEQKAESDLKNDLISRYGLSDNQVAILTAVLQNKFVTQQQLSELIGITPKNIRNNMARLKSKGLLKRSK